MVVILDITANDKSDAHGLRPLWMSGGFRLQRIRCLILRAALAADGAE
jgi:hypothetical protein